jgi:hypothetical protein
LALRFGCSELAALHVIKGSPNASLLGKILASYYEQDIRMSIPICILSRTP